MDNLSIKKMEKTLEAYGCGVVAVKIIYMQHIRFHNGGRIVQKLKKVNFHQPHNIQKRIKIKHISLFIVQLEFLEVERLRDISQTHIIVIMKITVIGCGRWGSLITWYLAEKRGLDVTLYGREGSEHIQRFIKERKNMYVISEPKAIIVKITLANINKIIGIKPSHAILLKEYIVPNAFVAFVIILPI